METRREKAARLAREMSAVIRTEARRRWRGVRTAERNARGTHVWRFRTGPAGEARYLHVPLEALAHRQSSAPALLALLAEGRWIDRLESGPDRALVLSRGGTLEAWSGEDGETVRR